MAQFNIFRWLSGRGWLVLAGGGEPESDDNLAITARVLGITHSQGPIAYIWGAADTETADQHMDVLRDLGARTGYLVDVFSENDADLQRDLDAAGVIILGDGPRTHDLQEALVGAALDSIQTAYSRGATVYAIGRSAAVLGSQGLEDQQPVAGFGWLANALVLPGYQSTDSDRLRHWLAQRPDAYGLGLASGAALALGPASQVELWGNEAVTVLLGQQFNSGVMMKGE